MLTLVLTDAGQPDLLVETLSSFVTAAADGLVCDVIILAVDPNELTRRIADEMGALLITPYNDPAAFIRSHARGDWILLIDCGLVPQPQTMQEMVSFAQAYRRTGGTAWLVGQPLRALSVSRRIRRWRAQFARLGGGKPQRIGLLQRKVDFCLSAPVRPHRFLKAELDDFAS